MSDETNNSTNLSEDDITPMTIVSTMVRPSGKYSLNEGDMLGSYRIRKPLGRGGMGEVYLALHTKLNVLRAIKILPARFCAADKNYGERFLQEARMAIQMEHPNVINVYDAEYDEKREIYYSVMEYVDGGTVRNSIRSLGTYMEKQALMIIMKVSEALIAAEKANLVHRDIKPDNIMLTRNGVVKLADLGIAKTNFNDPTAKFKEKTQLTGTPAYMSPEQATDPNSVDIRADIYSLGVTLFEMLTGTKPYTGSETVDIIRQVLHDPVPDPRKINGQITKTCAALIMKMMAKKREDRHPDAESLNRDLKALLSGNISMIAAEKTMARIEFSAIQGEWYDKLKVKAAELVKNHWFLCGITAGATFFVLALIAAICMICILSPGKDDPGSKQIQQNKSNVRVKTIK